MFVGWLVFVGMALPSHADDQPPLTHQLKSVSESPPAPALRLHDLEDEVVAIGQFKGRVVVVNFWATWCPPCRREMGSLQRLYQATKDQGLEILAVNIGEDQDTVFAFLGEIEPTPSFPMLFDQEAASLAAWGVRGLPTTFIVRPNGRIAYRAVGGREFDHPEIQAKIKALMDQ